MWRSMRIRNYRIWFSGALVSNLGTWLQTTALTWLVLTQLTDDDAAAVGVLVAMQYLPPLLLVPITGWVADRVDRRRALLLLNGILGILSLAIGVLLLLGALTLPLLYALVLGMGVAIAFESPMRNAFVSNLVDDELTSNAVSLNSASFNGARLMGPAIAGWLLLAIGTGWSIVLNAFSFFNMTLALALIRTRELVPRARITRATGFADGFRYMSTRSDLVVLTLMAVLLTAFGVNFPIYASTMAREFGQEANAFGIIVSMLGIGSLTGALLSARRRARVGVAIAAALLFAVAQAVSSFMPDMWAYGTVAVFVGFAVTTAMTTANGYIQSATAVHLRGRVIAIYMALVFGGTPLGALAIGWTTNAAGPRAAIWLAAGAGTVAFLLGLLWHLLIGRPTRLAEIAAPDPEPGQAPVATSVEEEV
ncbi:MAG: MFS transporter [Microbacterium sp.]